MNTALSDCAGITPGKWQAIEWMCHAPTTVAVSTPTGIQVIAECSGHGRWTKDCLADARLIASSPELLSACIGLLNIAETGVTSLGVIRAARAAIVKATTRISA